MKKKDLNIEKVLLIKRFEIFANNISIIHKNISKLKKEVMKECGLSGNDGLYLSYLILYRDGLTVSQLAETIGVDKAAVSRAFSSLYKKGYIYYPDFYGDKKYNTPAVATEEAKKMMLPVIDTISGMIDSISLTGIDEDNRTIMYRTLRTTAVNIAECLKNYEQ